MFFYSRRRDPRLKNNPSTTDEGSDVDWRQLPFKPAPVHTPANEILASINSHPPVNYRMVPISPPPVPDYSKVQPKVCINGQNIPYSNSM